jgi:hypothetical protein
MPKTIACHKSGRALKLPLFPLRLWESHFFEAFNQSKMRVLQVGLKLYSAVKELGQEYLRNDP